MGVADPAHGREPCSDGIPLKETGCRRRRFRRQAAATTGRPPWLHSWAAVVLADDRFDRGDGPTSACATATIRASGDVVCRRALFLADLAARAGPATVVKTG